MKPAARQLNIRLMTLKRWRWKADELLALSNDSGFDATRRIRVPGSGRPPKIGKDIEGQLISYFDETRGNGINVNVRKLYLFLCSIDDSYQHMNCSRVQYCIRRMLRRHHIVLRRTTHQAQNTRYCNDVISDWAAYIKGDMSMYQIGHDCIANFDETAVYFSPECSVTLNRRGERTISVRKADSSQRCTVMIGVSGDGHKFPPFVVFKGSVGRTGRIVVELRRVAQQQQISYDGEFNGFPLSNFHSVQPKAWMDTSTMLDWVEQVWKPWTATKNGAQTMLILDEFSAHMTFDVRRAIADCGTYLEFVTGGYTSRLQVMDVGLNKPFKNHYRNSYDAWFMSATQGTKPLRSDVSRWIAESWAEIGDSVIQNSWRKIGLPNPSIAAGVANEEATMDEADPEELHDDLGISHYDINVDDNNLDEYPDNGHHEPMQGTAGE